MSTKDLLKRSQGGNERPQLEVLNRISCKLGADIKKPEPLPEGYTEPDPAKVYFTFYDKEEKCDKFYTKIQGLLIGNAMRMTAYSNQLNASYESDYYVTNKNILLFSPSKSKTKRFISGSREEIEHFLSNETNAQPKKRKILFVLTSKGLLAIETNMVIGIEQLNNFKTTFQQHYIVLEPKLYDKNDKTISKNAHELLGKLAPKNPPRYANIIKGDEIVDDKVAEWDVLKYVEMFETWKAYKMKTANLEMKEEVKDEPETLQQESSEVPESDDLPF